MVEEEEEAEENDVRRAREMEVGEKASVETRGAAIKGADTDKIDDEY